MKTMLADVNSNRFLQIPSQATVDCEREPKGNSLGVYRVEVVGREPNDYARVYHISAKSEQVAAFDGMSRFHDELVAAQKE